jgi:predicted PurR-regulated permease PerM
MFAGAYLLWAILILVVAIAWIILPFALIGTKPLLRQLITEVKRNNELLDQRLPALKPPR